MSSVTQETQDGSIFDLFADFDSADLPFNNGSLALEAGRSLISGRTYLLGLSVLNTNASAQYIQLHDVSGVAASGAIPKAVFTVAGASNLVIAWTMPGRRFRQGIYVTNSSTAATLTAGSADCFYDAQFVSVGVIV